MPVEMITGNQAAALGAQRAGINLAVAYPITPQTAIVETLAGLWSKGELGAEFVNVESEYAALSYCMGAAATGARIFTATSAHGLAYMHEMIHWCSGARFPMVMVNVNRAMGAPWCLDPDQIDSLSQRDTGWIQLYCSNAQEVLDTVMQAFALSERVLLPCMVVFDGFYISHTYEAVDLPDRETVARFIGPPDFTPQVDPANPQNLHGLVGGEVLAGLVRARHEAMSCVGEVLDDLNQKFREIFGRSYQLVEGTALEGARTVIVTAGSCAETVSSALPALGNTGLIRLKALRPFPVRELRALVAKSEAERVVVVDRNCSPGLGGILTQEVRAALYGSGRGPAVQSLILAGGIDFTPRMLEQALNRPAAGNGDPLSAEIWGLDLHEA